MCTPASARALALALFAERSARRGATRTERLSTGSYFPVRQHGCRLSLVIAVPRATACVLPTRITPSSLARLSHFKRPLPLPRHLPPTLFSRFAPSFFVFSSFSSSSSSCVRPHRCVRGVRTCVTRPLPPPARSLATVSTSCSLSTRDANGIDDN